MRALPPNPKSRVTSKQKKSSPAKSLKTNKPAPPPHQDTCEIQSPLPHNHLRMQANSHLATNPPHRPTALCAPNSVRFPGISIEPNSPQPNPMQTNKTGQNKMGLFGFKKHQKTAKNTEKQQKTPAFRPKYAAQTQFPGFRTGIAPLSPQSIPKTSTCSPGHPQLLPARLTELPNNTHSLYLLIHLVAGPCNLLAQNPLPFGNIKSCQIEPFHPVPCISSF